MNQILQSRTSVFVPMIHAISHVDDMLGPNRQWTAINPGQEQFLVVFDKARKEIKIIPESELKYKVSQDVEVLNKFLADNGFSIKLEKFNRELGEFGVVSIMDILVKWLVEGVITEVKGPEQQAYPAFRLKEGVEFFRNLSYYEVIIKITTKTSDVVFLTMSEQLSSFYLLEMAQKLVCSLVPCHDYDRVVIPMVDLNHEVDISWLSGMQTFDDDGKDWLINQALQQTKFKMNEKGARAKSAVAVSVMKMCIGVPKKELVIDKPFLVWIQRPGISVPLFSGWINTDCWKDPGSLENM
jgi:hypothetical protein